MKIFCKAKEVRFTVPCIRPWAIPTMSWKKRPVIGIANSWTTLVPGHANLKQVAESVKNGIYRGGGMAVEFGVIAACDGIAQGHDGMHFILPSRELICDSIEVQARAHRLDALVLLGSCDKIVPGMLMAAARLDMPAIMVHGGPMAGGVVFDGRKSDLTSISEARGMYSSARSTSTSTKPWKTRLVPDAAPAPSWARPTRCAA